MHTKLHDLTQDVRQHTISVLVENRFGVLARVAALFSGRGYNIDSLTVNATVSPTVSRMTIVTKGDEHIMDQIDKQLNKLIDVIKVTDLSGDDFIERELALIKVQADTSTRSEIIQLAEIFEAKIVTVTRKELGIEISGQAQQIDNFLTLLNDFGIIEVARSGRVAISRKSGKIDA